jgi:hypothetical protein
VLAAVEATIPVHPSFASLVTANPRNPDTPVHPAPTLIRFFKWPATLSKRRPVDPVLLRLFCGMAKL